MMPEEKEPWQMTGNEWLAFSEAETKRAGFEWTADSVEHMTRQHKLQVRSAIAAKLPIPDEVLADYPDLAEAIPKAEIIPEAGLPVPEVTPVTPEVTRLTGDTWNRMTPIEREQLGVKAKLDAERRGTHWIELFPEEKRALIREFKKEPIAIPTEVEVMGASMSRWLTPTQFANLVIMAVESGMDLEEAIQTTRGEAREAGVPEEVIDEGVEIAEKHFEEEEGE